MEGTLGTVVSLLIGIGLSAACGFRVFIPLLALSIAALSGKVELSDTFAWIGTWPACIAFGAATIVEIAAYYIPWLDNALDSIATPLAIAAGVITSAALLADVHPLIQWSLGIIAGGGAAGSVQAITASTRATSSMTTAGIGNPIVSTVEAVSSTALSVIAILLPVLAVLLFAAIIYVFIRLFFKRKRKARTLADAWRSPYAQ
ncbi:MAG: DUF4126 domain-containing protein [Planctomycetota bacterium]